MKYVEAMQSKGFAPEELSKGLQEKIAKVEKLVGKIYKIEQKTKKSAADQSLISELTDQVASLDDYLEKRIVKFDPEIQEKRLAMAAKAQKAASEMTVPKQVNKPAKVDELKKTVKVNAKADLGQEIEKEQPQVVVQEAAKADDYQLQPVQPKRNGWALILMVAGCVAMAVGAYTYFKKK